MLLALTVGDLNQRLTDIEFRYGRCGSCGTYSLLNVPEDLGRYYVASYYETMDEAQRQDAAIADDQLARIAAFRGGGRVLEVGPGRGAWLQRAAARGFVERAAVERDALSCGVLRADGVNVVETDDPVEGVRRLPAFDVIGMFHVIEHVPRPMELLDALAEKLLPGGALMIAAPNPESVAFRVCGKHWLHLDAPRHLHLLPLDVVAGRLASSGLTLVNRTTVDAGGLACDEAAWGLWVRHVTIGPRTAYHLQGLVRRVVAPIERRGMRGSAWTATFQR